MTRPPADADPPAPATPPDPVPDPVASIADPLSAPAGPVVDPVDPVPDPAPHPSARDLVRGRRRPGRLPDTGRRHHIGPAPEAVPLHTPTGIEVTRVTAWQLADRTPAQLAAQRTTTVEQMQRAAEELDFESAARLRDELTAVEAELSRRAAPAGAGSHPAGAQPPEAPPPQEPQPGR